ncbi:hypothetical protein A2856_00440 [Candidatus Uhrbacteria bacterium RIFCSPHIGHO2_01_FULL_63_20]|uniref:Uncharacterized protein n=1 Tax=Candidatus Uhrbacteria bacterium RIFCSPHIGHO2_01_FULL_63_20 TaxID=1802385 RepID=A0A1F7TN30_9BACT|nr:MAG: hypothetical protein A2856_00440 [Candidatus Uhrbacteria bacterium RIFCSPHIGHO2_01_FULL_63_20]
MTVTTVAQALRDLFEKDPSARPRLEKKLCQNGLVERLLEDDLPSNLIPRCGPALRSEGIDPNTFTLARAKSELWGATDPLPDIDTHQKLGTAVLALRQRFTMNQINVHVGLTSNDSLKLACRAEAFPTLKTMKGMLEVVHADRRGTLKDGRREKKAVPKVAPKAAAKSDTNADRNPWTCLRELAKRDVDRYGSRSVAKKLGVTDNVIRFRWKGAFDPDRPLDRKLVAAYPELRSAPANVVTMASAPKAAPVRTPEANEGTVPMMVAYALATLRASVNQLASLHSLGVVTDGHRMQFYAEVRKLFERTGFDQAVFERLNNVSPITDPSLQKIIKGIGHGR